MSRRLPPLALLISVLGVIPFIGAGLEATSMNPVIGQLAGHILVAYGAVILSFLGAVHWGFALALEEDDRTVAERERLVLGVLPALVGWLAVCISLAALRPAFALVVEIAGFLGVAVVEWRAHQRGLVPGGYIGMRLVVTAVVVVILITVTTLRFIGAHLIF